MYNCWSVGCKLHLKRVLQQTTVPKWTAVFHVECEQGGAGCSLLREDRVVNLNHMITAIRIIAQNLNQSRTKIRFPEWMQTGGISAQTPFFWGGGDFAAQLFCKGCGLSMCVKADESTVTMTL